MDEYREAVLAVQTFARGEVRYRSSSMPVGSTQRPGKCCGGRAGSRAGHVIVWGLLGLVAAVYGVRRRRAG